MEVVHRGKVSVKGVQIARFPLSGSAIFQWMVPMSYTFRRLLNHLPIALGMRSDKRLRTTRVKHA
jgi:hypothetical protein